MCLCIFFHINIILNNYFKKKEMNANEDMLAGYADPDAT